MSSDVEFFKSCFKTKIFNFEECNLFESNSIQDDFLGLLNVIHF